MRQTNADRARETRAEYIRLGLCPYCYGVRRAEPDHEGCRTCMEKRNRSYNARQRIAEGRCSRCAEPLEDKRTVCARCWERDNLIQRRGYERAVASGNCTQCGRAARPGRILCDACADNLNAKARTRHARFVTKRQTCEHETLRVQVRVLVLSEEGVRVLWVQCCCHCHKRHQYTLWAQPDRLVQVLSWVRGDDA